MADSPKELIRDLSEDLLRRFAGLPLLDRYDVYQCQMDYWDEVMQDNVHLVVTEGWTEAARSRTALAHGASMKSYLIVLAVRLLEMRRVIQPTGSIYSEGRPIAPRKAPERSVRVRRTS